MVEICENCKFYRDLKIDKHDPKLTLYEERKCCIMLAVTEPDGFVLEVEPDSVCEVFSNKVDKDKSLKLS